MLWKLATPALIVLKYVNGKPFTTRPLVNVSSYSSSSSSMPCNDASTLIVTSVTVSHKGHVADTSTSSPPLAPLIAISNASTSALNIFLGSLMSGTQDLIKLATASPFNNASGFFSISSSFVVIGKIANSPLSGTVIIFSS